MLFRSHFDFDKPTNNFAAAVSQYASWGFFDPGKNNYHDGYQSPPVNWGLNTERKSGFFRLLAQITDAEVPVSVPKPAAPVQPAAVRPQGRVSQITYHGWTNALFLSNESAHVVIVPALGRVMQFGLLGEEGVFWENRALDGRLPDWNTTDWANFGGDKTWPAPEANWSKYTQRAGRRPPPAFDAMPVEARVEPGGAVTLISPVDPFYNIRVQRRVHLHPLLPVMTITTTYERVSGAPIQVGVSVLTQLNDPDGVYALLPDKKRGAGYALLSKDHPAEIKYKKGLLSLERDKKTGRKIGCEAGSLLWVGRACSLRIDSPRVPEAVYPDQGSSAEIYTSPDPLKYVELGMLGPLRTLKAGERIEQTSTYTLIRRSESKPEAEARKIFGL